MTELIPSRHGETYRNGELRLQGEVDVPLNATGLEQAGRVVQRLLAERFGVEHLVCSDLLRTRQTAEPAAQALLPHLSLDAVADPGLREQNFGIVDGLRVQDVKTDYAEAWERWVRFEADYGMPGGETTRQFHTRVMDAVQRIAQQYAGKTVLVVTHGGVLDMVWRSAHALGLDGPRRSEIPNVGVNRVRITDAGAPQQRIEILDWADIAHLQDMQPQPRYDQSRDLDTPR